MIDVGDFNVLYNAELSKQVLHHTFNSFASM